MRILFVSSEVYPYAKTGGLADVSYSLPKTLYELGHDVRVMMPKYRHVQKVQPNLTHTIHNLNVPVSNQLETCDLYQSCFDDFKNSTQCDDRNVPIYFIGHDEYFDREDLYQSEQGDYEDNAARFIFFCRAVVEVVKKIGFRPDIIHCNDWQTALIPVYLKSLYHGDPFFDSTGCVFTIHNMGYQGQFWHFDMHLIGLGWEYFTADTLEYFGKINLLKGGLIFSDVITTVSTTYAEEIQTEEYGHGLEGVLQSQRDKLYGITNGIDVSLWSPVTDTQIVQNYSSDDLSGKELCKKALLEEAGLALDLDIPLIGMISRLEAHKGFDIFMEVAEQMLKIPVSIIILGQGRRKYHRFFQKLAQKYPDKVKTLLTFDNSLAHKIEAGCDLFLMPSYYEPSGLNHLYSMRYGTVPITRKTGGLADTVTDYDPVSGQGNGFVFEEFSGDALLDCVKRAGTVYQRKNEWKKIMRFGMNQDFTWTHSAQRYLEIYKLAKKEQFNREKI